MTINWRKPIIYFLSWIQGSKRFKYYSRILQYQKMTKEELKNLQKEKLRKLLLYSYENIPYYREVLPESGVIKDGKVYLESFSNIPILTKDILRTRFKDLQIEGTTSDIGRKKTFLNKIFSSIWLGKYENHSGGSTGEPTRFIQDKEYDDWNIANKMAYRDIVGHKIGMKELRLWGSERDFLGDREDQIMLIRNFFFNRKDLNAFKMTQEEMRKYCEIINTWKPLWIEAYVTPIYELAKFAEKENIKMFSPLGIVSSAGTLYPEIKETLKEVFHCPILNRYGSREVGDIACGEDELRISVWNQKVEVLKSNKKNELGKVIVTNLNNYSMPLIRYDIGDIAQESTKWGYLKKIEGRESEVFRNRKGKVIPGLLFVHFLGVVMNEGAIKQFQMIQKDYEDIEIKVVVGDRDEFENMKKDVQELVDKAMETKCNIIWEEVDNIPPLKSGKYMYIKSEVKE